MGLLQLVCCSAKANSAATIICPSGRYGGFVNYGDCIDRLPKRDEYRPRYDAQRAIRMV